MGVTKRVVQILGQSSGGLLGSQIFVVPTQTRSRVVFLGASNGDDAILLSPSSFIIVDHQDYNLMPFRSCDVSTVIGMEDNIDTIKSSVGGNTKNHLEAVLPR
jgi:hypothetical protein